MKKDWEVEFNKLYWANRLAKTITKQQYCALKSFCLDAIHQERERILELLSKIAVWEEPQAGAGEGMGALAGAGMYMQYTIDKKKHETQIADLKTEIKKL